MKSESHIIEEWQWVEEIKNRDAKESIASQIANKVKEGDVIGVGSGSTSYLALEAIASRIHTEHLHVQVIPTSLEMTFFCNQFELPVTTLAEHMPDWSFDGTDEIDPFNNLIKGRGGVMFKEKLIIRSSPVSYILADASKRVERLGERFPVPLEVYPQALPYVEKALQIYLPNTMKLRMAEGKDGPVITENGNLILDVWFDEIPRQFERSLKGITGVIETDLFQNYKNIQIIQNQQSVDKNPCSRNTFRKTSEKYSLFFFVYRISVNTCAKVSLSFSFTY